uniref:Cytochrome n=1 Tax=Lutzomyia longipalpis TaxID=7200 RepID=A0A1B0CWX5_LUTLO
MAWLWIAFVTIIWLLLKYGIRNQNFFLDRGVKFHDPLPFVGNSLRFFLNKENMKSHILKLCKKFPKEKIFGQFDAMKPILVVQDPELLKTLTIKEFDHFTDHQPVGVRDIDPLFSHSLIMLEGNKWREMRSNLSPAFTGSKMRLMSALIVEICEQMVDYLKTEAKEKGPQAYEMKELFSRVATDIIGTCAFGIKVDSLKERENKFFVTASKMFNTTSIKLAFKLIGIRIFPSVMKLCGIKIFDEIYKGFLKDLVLSNMKTRQEKNIVRPDMINLLIEAQKGTLEQITTPEKDSVGFATVEEIQSGPIAKKTSWTDDEIVSQCFIFFLAGFDTSSTVLSFATYELAKSPEIQEKLYEEAKVFHDELNGKPLKYETLQKMKYLDMVVSEALRMWPPAPATDRSRFALMEVKAMIFYLIVNFHFDLSDKTDVPMILAASFVGLKAKNGIWVKFRPRK